MSARSVVLRRAAIGAVAAVGSLTAACDRTPPVDLLRIADSGVSAQWAAPRDAGPPWVPGSCRPLPEREIAASFSDLTFSGECPVHISLPVKCLAQGDDFYIAADRPLEGGRSLELFLNVESFSGAGEYEHQVELRVIVRDGATLYQWVHYQGSASLGARDSAGATGSFHMSSAAAVTFVVLPSVSLYAAPGTPTSGFIKLEGTLGCAPPGSSAPLAAPAP